MKKQLYITIFFLISITHLCSAQSLKSLKEAAEKQLKVVSTEAGLSQEEIAAGLKEALTKGVEKGVDKISLPDGFFKDLEIKILMPEDAKNVEDKLRKMGQGKKVDDAIESLNRAAEDASIKAKEIFVNAIKSMTLADAKSILDGEDNAATSFLEKSTRTDLFNEFSPVVKTSLDKVGATKHWTTIFTTYNKLPMVEIGRAHV